MIQIYVNPKNRYVLLSRVSVQWFISCALYDRVECTYLLFASVEYLKAAGSQLNPTPFQHNLPTDIKLRQVKNVAIYSTTTFFYLKNALLRNEIFYVKNTLLEDDIIL